ncbi:MAG: hypothetical protein NVS1B1_12590 [Candidatus Limnocylindrales bacterium]
MPLTAEVRAFLDDPHFAVLATVGRGGLPQQSVMWYLLEGDEIMFNTKAGRAKERYLRDDPRVSLLIGGEYRYVRVTGRVREIRDLPVAHADIHRLAVRYTGAAAAEESMERFGLEERITYRMPIDRVYAYGF